MAALDVCISFVAVLALCVFFSAACRVNSAVAPLLALCSCLLFFTLGGVLGLLRPAGYLFFLLALAALVYTLVKRGVQPALESLLTPGFLLFFAAGTVCLLYFAARRPEFSAWDEFSFWGTAAKLLVQDNSLYTTADIGWQWPGTQSPALPILGYFAQFFGSGFAAWKVYWGVNLLQFACFAALLAPFKPRAWRLWLPAGVIALALPFVLNVPYRIVYLSPGYLSAYGDLPAGFLAGAALAVYLYGRRAGKGALWALLPLAASALVKENTFPITLVAAAVMVVDTLFFAPGKQTVAGQGRLRRAVGIVSCFAAPLAAYAVWAVHRGWASARHPVTAAGGTGGSTLDAAVNGLLQLVGIRPKTERYAIVLRDFWAALFSRKEFPVSLFGSVATTLLAVLAVMVLCVCLAKRGVRRRLVVGGSLLLLGFIGYEFVILVSYGFLFKAEGILDWQRYQGSYVAFLLVVALALLFDACAGRGCLPAKTGLLTCATVLLVVLGSFAPAQLTVLGYNDIQYDTQREQDAFAARLRAALPEGSRVFFVAQGSDGGEWFEYSYHLLPLVLDYSIEGGSTLATEGENGVDAGELTAYLTENGCNAILVYALDEEFVQEYNSLFHDLEYPQGEPLVYLRGADGLYSRLAV